MENLESEVKLSPPRGRPLKNSMMGDRGTKSRTSLSLSLSAFAALQPWALKVRENLQRRPEKSKRKSRSYTLTQSQRLKAKTQRVKTSENLSEESNLPRRFRRYPEILQNPVKVGSEKSSEISSANIFFFREVFRSFCPLRFYPLDLSDTQFANGNRGCNLESVMRIRFLAPALNSRIPCQGFLSATRSRMEIGWKITRRSGSGVESGS